MTDYNRDSETYSAELGIATERELERMIDLEEVLGENMTILFSCLP